MKHPGPVSHHARKIIRVGRSFAIVIPPHVLDHLGAEIGDFLVWDISAKRFAVLSVGAVPPYVEKPSLFTSDDSGTVPTS